MPLTIWNCVLSYQQNNNFSELATWYLLPGIKGSSKTNMPSSKYWWPWNSPVAILCQIYDQTQFHMVKDIDNAFDRMELCFVLSAE